MHLGGPGLPQHTDQCPLGVAPHDRVVHHHQPPPSDHLTQRVQLQPDTQLPDGLTRLDEGAPDIGVLHQSQPELDTRFGGEPERGRSARVGHRHDQIAARRVLPGQQPADLYPDGLHGTIGDPGIRPGQIDVFEDAPPGRRFGEPHAALPGGIYPDQFTGLDLPDEGGPHDVERSGFGGHHPAVCQAPQYQRTYPVAVACRVERGLGHEDQAEGPDQDRQHRKRGVLKPGTAGLAGQQLGDQRGVIGGIEGVLARHRIGDAPGGQHGRQLLGVG